MQIFFRIYLVRNIAVIYIMLNVELLMIDAKRAPACIELVENEISDFAWLLDFSFT